MRFPPSPPPPPPRLLHLLSLVPSPLPPPPPKLRCCWAWHLWLWCSDRGILSKEGWPVKYDRGAGIFDGSEPWENSAGAQEAGYDQQRPLAPAPLESLIRDLETNGEWRGVGLSLACTWSHIRSISVEELRHTQDLLDVTWTVSSFSYIFMRFKWRAKVNVMWRLA